MAAGRGRELGLVLHELTPVASVSDVDGGDDRATCLFTACPHSEGFSAAPDQSKEFMFMRTTGDRLLIRPTNMVLFEERSFTIDTGWPTDIMTSTQVWQSE